MPQPTIEKPIKHIIAEYVEKKDLYGLAEYFRAYIEDELAENEERKLCNSGRRMYQQGMKDERKRCVEIVEKKKYENRINEVEGRNKDLDELIKNINTK